MRLLCISNGHGEDMIAVRVLAALRQQSPVSELFALPLVGEGSAYQQAHIPIVGPTQLMPSGGFIYMDGRELARDLRGGLVQLAIAQFRAMRQWRKAGGYVLAVGDILPLLYAWLSGLPYAFTGTAKSDYYLRDEQGPLPRQSWSGKWESRMPSVYLPWERWLMSRRRCRAVFPRDPLTTERLQRWSIPAVAAGNPMMDRLEPTQRGPLIPMADVAEEKQALTFVLLPGSRVPEAYRNWQVLMQAVSALQRTFPNRRLRFLAAIAPSLEKGPLQTALVEQGWTAQRGNEPIPDSTGTVIATTQQISAYPTYTCHKSTLALIRDAYADCLQQGDIAIAMAGTATEQFVGLGKPAVTFPGAGPQFTYAFAEAQSRLLGPSILLLQKPTDIGPAICNLLMDPDRLQIISDNGRRRMGEAGAAQRIAERLLAEFSVP